MGLAMLRRDLNMAELSRITKISMTALYCMRRGASSSAEKWIKVAKVLKMPVSVLCPGMEIFDDCVGEEEKPFLPKPIVESFINRERYRPKYIQPRSYDSSINKINAALENILDNRFALLQIQEVVEYALKRRKRRII